MTGEYAPETKSIQKSVSISTGTSSHANVSQALSRCLPVLKDKKLIQERLTVCHSLYFTLNCILHRQIQWMSHLLNLMVCHKSGWKVETSGKCAHMKSQEWGSVQMEATGTSQPVSASFIKIAQTNVQRTRKFIPLKRACVKKVTGLMISSTQSGHMRHTLGQQRNLAGRITKMKESCLMKSSRRQFALINGQSVMIVLNVISGMLNILTNQLVNAFHCFNALRFVRIIMCKSQQLDVVVYLMIWFSRFSQAGQLREISTMLKNLVFKTQA